MSYSIHGLLSAVIRAELPSGSRHVLFFAHFYFKSLHSDAAQWPSVLPFWAGKGSYLSPRAKCCAQHAFDLRGSRWGYSSNFPFAEIHLDSNCSKWDRELGDSLHKKRGLFPLLCNGFDWRMNVFVLMEGLGHQNLEGEHTVTHPLNLTGSLWAHPCKETAQGHCHGQT